MNDKLVTKSFSIWDLDKIVKKTRKAQSFVNSNVTDYDIINAILASVSWTIVGAAQQLLWADQQVLWQQASQLQLF